MLQKYKAESASRLQEQKRAEERRRNVLVLIYRHLIASGFGEAALAMSKECSLDLEKWEVADNIDLFYIVQDFEDYFETRFLKKPVIVKKSQELTERDVRIKRMGGMPPKSVSKSSVKENTPKRSGSASKNPRQNSLVGKYKQIGERSELGIEVTGKRIEAEEEAAQDEDFYENRVLQPLPDYSHSSELKELAVAI
jgi:katanin p60 ATPase-containing subunit A1